MPYRCEALPDPLSALWMPYAEMYEEFGRELANAINAFSNQVHSLAAWAALTAVVTDKRKMVVAHEFVDTLATNALNAPYMLRSRFIFATAHLSHQANRSQDSTWIDDLPLDDNIYMAVADRYGARWRRYNALKLRLEAVAGRDFRTATHDFRNAYNHRFSPRFVLGITQFVTRHLDPASREVSYGFGGTPALELPHVVTVLTRKRDLVYRAFDAFQFLVQEQADAIKAF